MDAHNTLLCYCCFCTFNSIQQKKSKKGKYIIFGFTAPPEEYESTINRVQTWDANHDDDKNMINFGVIEPYTEDLSKLANYLADGKINPLVYDRIPLTEASRAHQLLESGAVTGKIVLISKLQ